MRSKEYWKKRSLRREKEFDNKAKEYLKDLEKEFRVSMTAIDKRIEQLYKRFAKDNKLTYYEARKKLDKTDLEVFKKQVDKYLADNVMNDTYNRYLRNLSSKGSITRLQALQSEIRHEIETLYNSFQDSIEKYLIDVYEENYYRSIYEIQIGTNIGTSFVRLNRQALSFVIHYDWSGKDYSDRIWKHKTKLLKTIKSQFKQGLIQGKSNHELAKKVAKRMNVAYSNAFRLVRTENNYIYNASNKKSYEQSGIVMKYRFIATLDRRTSSKCRKKDNKVFNIKDALVGTNYPPLHPNCRSTTIPIFDKVMDINKFRRAKSLGRYYFVPSNLSYEKWYKKYGA
ncbi:minor capsid protein [Vallitalea maricola]|uniref:Minor capsid protein n=1 Tax=Vallitalea maricola TaxID=3074433 RepID=A0ACB5UEV9_9FIRM|nr:minor capsid protein [Vallitalea sp. AN17-2]